MRWSWKLVLLLLVGLVHGLGYIFVVPPWQHYDEPTHFEYVWLSAHRSAVPDREAYDSALSRAVTRSMIAHDFYRGMSVSIPDPDDPALLHVPGVPQLGDPPLYYLWASLPLRLPLQMSVTVQLYAARMASLVLFLLTLIAVWGWVAEVTSPGNPLRWMVPFTVALWPGFVDIMSAVNNDVGAVMAFAFFLWASTRLMRRGFGWKRLLALALTVLACLGVKQNTYIAVPLAVLALAFSVLRGRWRPVVWLGLLASCTVVVVALFSWDDAWLWGRYGFPDAATRVKRDEAPWGQYALRLAFDQAAASPSMIQLLPTETAKALSGKTLTLGGWFWANAPVEAVPLMFGVYDGNRGFGTSLHLTSTPVFHAFTFRLEGNTTRSWVSLGLPGGAAPAGAVLYADGLVLAEGERPLDQPPVFTDQTGESGVWGGQAFENILRNPSAELAGPCLRTWVDRYAKRIAQTYGYPSLVVYSLTDWSGAGWYYDTMARGMFRTFWAKFGWGHVPLLGQKPYRVLLILTLLALPGLLAALLRYRRKLPWDVIACVSIAVLFVMTIGSLRGATMVLSRPWYPGARYLYPVAAPIIALFCLGWLEIGRFLRRGLPGKVLAGGYLLFFVGLDLLAWISIVRFYA